MWLYAAIAFHIVSGSILGAVASHPYDLAALTGPAEAWLRWGFSPLYHWKFGLDYLGLTFLAQTLRAALAAFGIPGVVALHIAWRLPLIAADLLTAGAIYRLAIRYAPSRAISLASLWLLNPALLWVTSGHGQIESVALLCVFGALLLAIDGRLFISGFVTGLGVGIEYFPIVVLGAVLLWWRGGHLAARDSLPRFISGLAFSLAICFAPSLADPIGRQGLVGGLLFSGGYAGSSEVSQLSVWAWLGDSASPFWPLAFGLLATAAFCVAWRVTTRAPNIALAFVGVTLGLAVLLDANTLGLFALIAAAGLWLMAIATGVPSVPLVVVPTAGVFTYVIFLDRGLSNANAFFFDEWATSEVRLWPVPSNEPVALFLGYVFSIGLVLTLALSLRGISRWSKRASSAAAVVGAGFCLGLVAWASQPSIWQAAGHSPPTADIPDFEQFIATREGTISNDGSDAWTLTFPPELISASSSSATRPSAGIAIHFDDLFQREGVSRIIPPATWSEQAVVIPNWKDVHQSVQSVWVELLFGSPSWSFDAAPMPKELSLSANGLLVPASTDRVVAAKQGSVGWALVDFEVPAQIISPDGQLSIIPARAGLLWNGSGAGPWARIVPASGSLRASVNGTPAQMQYRSDSTGSGYALGLPLSGLVTVQLNSEFPGLSADGAVIKWPNTPNSWMSLGFVQIIGAAFALLVIVITTWALWLQTKPGAPDAWQLRQIPNVPNLESS